MIFVSNFSNSEDWVELKNLGNNGAEMLKWFTSQYVIFRFTVFVQLSKGNSKPLYVAGAFNMKTTYPKTVER